MSPSRVRHGQNLYFTLIVIGRSYGSEVIIDFRLPGINQWHFEKQLSHLRQPDCSGLSPDSLFTPWLKGAPRPKPLFKHNSILL